MRFAGTSVLTRCRTQPAVINICSHRGHRSTVRESDSLLLCPLVVACSGLLRQQWLFASKKLSKDFDIASQPVPTVLTLTRVRSPDFGLPSCISRTAHAHGKAFTSYCASREGASCVFFFFEVRVGPDHHRPLWAEPCMICFRPDSSNSPFTIFKVLGQIGQNGLLDLSVSGRPAKIEK